MRVSLVIPAYNEEGRLGAFLDALVHAQRTVTADIAEVLVVDDGSRDRTAAVAETYATRLPLRVLRLPRNRGKGAAVRQGVLEACGDVIVFMDADGATAPTELPKLLRALAMRPVAVGNRWMRESRVEEREPFRALSGWIYRTYASCFGLRGIDTMCGFKGFRRDAARALFDRLGEERWLFDTEVMLRAKRRRYVIANVPIAWTSKHGSKLRFGDLVQAFFTLPTVAARVAREEHTHPSPMDRTG